MAIKEQNEKCIELISSILNKIYQALTIIEGPVQEVKAEQKEESKESK